MKGGYKEKGLLAGSRDEPVIAQPEVYGGIDTSQFSFLLLYTRNGGALINRMVFKIVRAMHLGDL